MHLFYEYLQARHPEVLDFASYSPYLEMRQRIASLKHCDVWRINIK